MAGSKPAAPATAATTDRHHGSPSPTRRENSRLLSPPRRPGKERRNPSITPRKFNAFFAPRPRVSCPHQHPVGLRSARKALRDLATCQQNRYYQTPAPSSPLKPPEEEGARDDAQDENQQEHGRPKRRKMQHTPESSPCRPQLPEAGLLGDPAAQAGLLSPLMSSQRSQEKSAVQPALLSPLMSSQRSQETLVFDDSEDEDRIAPLTCRGPAGQLLQRQLGAMPKPGRSYMSFPVPDWRMETADFYTRPDDVHSCVSHDAPGSCIPFCATTFNTNSLVGIGDEEGRVRLLESGDASEPFKDIRLCFQAHSNAIIDMAVSSDDRLLATASGDQTGRVIDMMTQSPIAYMHEHTASLKQIRFQPGKANGSVLATSSRDGSVQIWDLRCKGPVQDIPSFPERDTSLTYRLPPPKSGCAVTSIRQAHARTLRQNQHPFAGALWDMPSRGEQPGRVSDVSVTALQFLPEGQEHLLLTACEADASIKLWDIRATSKSTKTVAPVSVTAPPSSHSNWRPFGVPSLALNTDGTRLYALCKDNTVYAYSMAHLMLGYAPELSLQPPRRRMCGGVTQQGLGPLYGFRHPSFHATSFYVKCAVRPARDGRAELLAAGSSDACTVLFPTSERYFRDDLSGLMPAQSLDYSTFASFSAPPPSLTSSCSSGSSFPFQLQRTCSNGMAYFDRDGIPIVRIGTPLVRGHDREVGALAWTNAGKLVSVGDDYLVRCWSEGREEAKDLRTGGETGGRRWGCGWADVGEGWAGDCEDDE